MREAFALQWVHNKRFMVYKGFIACSTPVLGEMAESQASGHDIFIPDVEPALFEVLLHFIYTEEPPEICVKTTAGCLYH